MHLPRRRINDSAPPRVKAVLEGESVLKNERVFDVQPLDKRQQLTDEGRPSAAQAPITMEEGMESADDELTPKPDVISYSTVISACQKVA